MSQKFIKSKNKNSFSQAYGKYFAQAVYDNHFVGTEELSDFIQRQASVKKNDIKAVLQELGEAFKHFFEMGQKIKLDGIGIFKVGFSSIGVTKLEDCGAQTITTRRILFQPETTRVVVGQQKMDDGSVKQKYVNAITMLKDVVFEETHDNAMNVEAEGSNSSNNSNGSNSSNSNSSNLGASESGGNGSVTPSVAKPTISGTSPFEETTEVSMTGPDGADIRYTTDGSTPTAESTLYESAFTLSASATVKAIAIKDGQSSQVASRQFTKGTDDDDSGDTN